MRSAPLAPNLSPVKGLARRRAAQALGCGAEDLVAERLVAKGYQILARRLRTKAGEIDLVAANAGRLLFVEVKARASFTEAAYAVSARQQARLLAAAELALALHPDWAREETRFDVALIAAGGVEMIEDALRL
ncbi:YraN family protein [Acidocella sp. KAb 2-4]|uniref:YraN family protein n=1 Tax=Acidocella sp. KAb 2-4 TaxID=2885158 RepID=UPI001D07D4E1|nr:YraN family protein [Acidocella sp. KAb 2-4]MCB5944938.1 YraN family protein [Acidocella sp. KAb 2-4]